MPLVNYCRKCRAEVPLGETCADCGAPLCDDCANEYSGLCPDCDRVEPGWVFHNLY